MYKLCCRYKNANDCETSASSVKKRKPALCWLLSSTDSQFTHTRTYVQTICQSKEHCCEWTAKREGSQQQGASTNVKIGNSGLPLPAWMLNSWIFLFFSSSLFNPSTRTKPTTPPSDAFIPPPQSAAVYKHRQQVACCLLLITSKSGTSLDRSDYSP